MKIPDHLITIGIADMLVGESGWTVPWAMYADYDGELYINGKYPFEMNKHGTVAMLIRRSDKGFVVDTAECGEHKWSLTGDIFVGGADALPVVEVTP